MRIRSIHPEFWRSSDVADLDWQTRLLFVGVWSYVDDNGVGRDVEKLIVAELFPLEDNPLDTLATVSRGLQALSDGGQIVRYIVDGKPYLHVVAWKKWQKIDRPGKERYPLPTREDAEIRETVATPSRDIRDTPSTGEGEKGRRGEGNTTSSKLDGDFLRFWSTYPKKVGKGQAVPAWKKALKKTDAESIIAGVVRYAATVDPQFIANPATWLNGERWADEVTPKRTQSAPAYAPLPLPDESELDWDDKAAS